MPTINQVQTVEPVLTGILTAYQQAAERFVAGRVFPAVPVQTDSGSYLKLTKNYWFRDGLQRRAPGDPFIRLDFGTESATYKTKQYAADEAIADEERANSTLPLDLERAAIEHLGVASLIRKELQFAADFMKTGVWGTDNTSATDWDDTSTGDPIADLIDAAGVISGATGFMPNTLVVGAIVDRALMKHPDVLDRLKYTQAATQNNIRSALAAMLGIENYIVSSAISITSVEGQTDVYAPIIDDDALLLYVNPAAGWNGVSAGKTFVWQPGGGAGSIYTYRDESRHADVIQHKEQWAQVAIAPELGYFFSDIV